VIAAAPDLLATARRLIASPDPQTRGLWARAAAVLTRQALEEGLARYWAKKAPGLDHAPFTAQLLCFAELFDDKALAAEVAWTWEALSSATHHHADPMPPGAADLTAWAATVERFLARVP